MRYNAVMLNSIPKVDVFTAQASRLHNESYTLDCAYVNPAFRGQFEASP